jgi:hypothetical protein
VTDPRDLQQKKQEAQIISMDEGMSIAVNPLSENAYCSSRDNLQSTANLTDRRDLQKEKQEPQITSMDEGM